MNGWIAGVGLTLALVGLGGCSNSIAGVRAEHAHGGGTARLYAVSADRAYDASANVLRRVGVEALEEHRADGYMLGHKEAGLGKGNGAYLGVWVEPSGADHARVTVVAQRETSLAIVTDMTEGGFHDELARALAAPPPAATAAASTPGAP